ncbi:transformer-2 protein homolog alpha-like, partial [Centruroides sculpturatus]|uniref:transformer-2 protein homolog alpha-like n=1 Tax=Centruroides sculpturatus TaxID=218467 RepID=UPI000C6E2C9D
LINYSDNPQPSRCLLVFGLSSQTREQDLILVFSRYSPLENVQVIYDVQTGRSHGFAFVYFKNLEDSQMARERCNGLEIDGFKVTVEYSITQAHMRGPTFRGYGGSDDDAGGSRGGGYRGRSPSHYQF